MTQRELDIYYFEHVQNSVAIPHNVSQRGTTYYNVVQRSRTWLQRSKNVTEREQNACTTLCCVSATLWYAIMRGDNKAQRGTLPKFVNLFPERGDQKRGTTTRPKCDTVTGALGNTTTTAVHIVNAFV